MVQFISNTLFSLAVLASMVSAQQCSGNTAMCPDNKDGVSPTFLQCNSWSHQYVSQNCPAGLFCYANPNKPGSVVCDYPGREGQGKCTGNTAKCKSPGASGDYLQCDRWAHRYVNAKCPNGTICYNNKTNTGVYCK